MHILQSSGQTGGNAKGKMQGNSCLFPPTPRPSSKTQAHVTRLPLVVKSFQALRFERQRARFSKFALLLGNEKCARTFFLLHKLFEHPHGGGTSRQNSWDIPDSSLRNPRKTNFRGRVRAFWPPPLRVDDPHPTGRSPDPKTSSLCSFFLPE